MIDAERDSPNELLLLEEELSDSESLSGSGRWLGTQSGPGSLLQSSITATVLAHWKTSAQGKRGLHCRKKGAVKGPNWGPKKEPPCFAKTNVA